MRCPSSGAELKKRQEVPLRPWDGDQPWIGGLSKLKRRLPENSEQAQRDEQDHGQDGIRPDVVWEVRVGFAFRHVLGRVVTDGAEQDARQCERRQYRIEDVPGPDRKASRISFRLPHAGSDGPCQRASRKWT